ncbi:MAG: hypothetical protein M1813_004722 [Trichoglossum hirsutum]|nr:MAG: hypothetical protein M1813_004722 [Trichoglossum hirsutum]
MKATFLFAIFALPFALAKVGDTCTYDGLKGTCTEVSKCTSGFTIKNYCPNDPVNIKCCIGKSCTSVNGNAGTCLNNPGSTCSGTFVTGRCPGPNDVQCCVASSPPPQINDVVVDFWIKAFIPLHVDGVTKTYPKDSSKSMIQGIPIIGDCFLTDQRGFDSASGAKSRMNSEAWIWVRPDGYSWSQEHHCDESTEVDCEDGDVEGTKTQTNNNMAFKELSGSSSKVVLDFKAARNNPLVTGSPDIDLIGTLTVDRVNKFVEFVGKVDEFPAFEAYVSINGGSPSTIAQLGPKPGAGPGSLIGDANRVFRGKVTF